MATPCTLGGANASGNHSTPTVVQSPAAKACVLCFLLPVLAVALLGNLLVAASVARSRKLRAPTDAFVVSLAAADFLLALLVMPFSLARALGAWRFGSAFCRVHFLLDVALCTSSIFNLSCVAWDRYVAVCDPLHYPSRMSSTTVAWLLLLSWLLPLLISSLCVPLGVFLEPPITAAATSCGATRQEVETCQATFQAPYALACSSLSFFIPAGFMLFAYGKIFMAARRQARWIHSVEHYAGQFRTDQNGGRPATPSVNGPESGCPSMKKERKAAKTLGLIMGVFLLCWFPFFCVNMVLPVWGYRVSPIILEVFTWLGYANSSLNPFLYAAVNRNYRQSFQALLACGVVGRQLRACLGTPPVAR